MDHNMKNIRFDQSLTPLPFKKPVQISCLKAISTIIYYINVNPSKTSDMSYSWQSKDEDELEEDGEVSGFATGKNLTIFLVEATKVMGESREGDPDGYNALQVDLLMPFICQVFLSSEVFELHS